MWANRDWVGRYFPVDTPKGGELTAYSSWCTAVEGNTTFYGLPAASTVARWARDAPPDFRFMFKLPQTITHEKRLRDVASELAETLQRLEPLGQRASPISIQLPASFGPESLGVLDHFLAGLSADWQWGVEVRSLAFSSGDAPERQLIELLARHNVERILIDTRAVFAGPRETAAEEEAFLRKPRLPVRPVAIGPSPVVRFIGQTDPAANPHWWSKWVPKIVEWIHEGRTPTVFLHTPDNVVAPELARQFHDEVRARIPELAPLPLPREPTAQLPLI